MRCMHGIIEFQKALKKGLIQKGHYFQTVATQRSVVTVSKGETGYNKDQEFITKQGETKLWRLVEAGKTAKDCRLFGPPTKKQLILLRRTGYENAIDILDKISAGTNIFTEFFKDVYSCRLPEREYEVRSSGWTTFLEKLKAELKKYEHIDDKNMTYFLASRCACLDGSNAEFGMFRVVGGGVGAIWLFNSNNYTYYSSDAVRPEAIPRGNLFLKMHDCDGSNEKPWICVHTK